MIEFGEVCELRSHVDHPHMFRIYPMSQVVFQLGRLENHDSHMLGCFIIVSSIVSFLSLHVVFKLHVYIIVTLDDGLMLFNKLKMYKDLYLLFVAFIITCVEWFVMHIHT